MIIEAIKQAVESLPPILLTAWGKKTGIKLTELGENSRQASKESDRRYTWGLFLIGLIFIVGLTGSISSFAYTANIAKLEGWSKNFLLTVETIETILLILFLGIGMIKVMRWQNKAHRDFHDANEQYAQALHEFGIDIRENCMLDDEGKFLYLFATNSHEMETILRMGATAMCRARRSFLYYSQPSKLDIFRATNCGNIYIEENNKFEKLWVVNIKFGFGFDKEAKARIFREAASTCETEAGKAELTK